MARIVPPRLTLVVPILFAPQGAPPAKVSVAPVFEYRFVSRLEVLGEVEAIREVALGVEVEGLIEHVAVDEGERVEAGQALLRLNTDIRKIRLRRAEAELELARQQLEEYKAGNREEDVRVARAFVAEAVARKDEADEQLARVMGLHKTEVASEKALTAARAVARQAAAALQRYQAELDRVVAGPRAEIVARAQQSVAVESAKHAEIADEIAKSSLKAPFAGAVTKRMVEVGGYLQRGASTFTLVQMDPIRVVLAVPELSIARVRVGAEVEITVDALPGETLVGKVEAVVPEAEKGARTFPVKVKLANSKFRLLPGMAARAKLALDDKKVLAIPSDAIVQTAVGNLVYVVRDGKAVRVPLPSIKTDGDVIEAPKGLAKGDKVVTRGNEQLFPGRPVIVLEDSGDKNPGDGR